MNYLKYVNTIVGAVADIPDIYTGTVPAGGGKTYPGRSGRDEMQKYGYIPGDISTTVENALQTGAPVSSRRPGEKKRMQRNWNSRL